MSIALPVTHAPGGAGNSSRCFTMYTPEYPVTHALTGGGTAYAVPQSIPTGHPVMHALTGGGTALLFHKVLNLYME